MSKEIIAVPDSDEKRKETPFSFTLIIKHGDILTDITSVISYKGNNVARKEFSMTSDGKIDPKTVTESLDSLFTEFREKFPEDHPLNSEIEVFSDSIREQVDRYFKRGFTEEYSEQ